MRGRIGLIAVLILPALFVAWFLHWWLIVVPLVLVTIMLVVAAIPIKRRVTPREWADELEKHLDGSEGPYDWDDATGVRLADKRLERLRVSQIAEYDILDTPEKRDRFRNLIESLRRGDIPNSHH